MQQTISDFKKLPGIQLGLVLGTMHFAEVTVTTETGSLWWKKKTVERKTIGKNSHWILWRFVDSGEVVDSTQVDKLSEAYEMREILKKTKND